MHIFAHKKEKKEKRKKEKKKRKKEERKAYRPSISHISNPYKGIGDSNGIYFKLFLRFKIDYESIMRF